MPMALVYLSGNYYSKNLLYNWQEFSSFHSKCLCWFDFLLKQITRFALVPIFAHLVYAPIPGHLLAFKYYTCIPRHLPA